LRQRAAEHAASDGETALDYIAQKPSFRKPFERRRCLVLADGFYEWKKTGCAKIPYRFVVKDDEPFAFAGLWERWRKPDDTELHSFVIITTEPNELAREVHDRMPVILAAEHYDAWLDPEFRDTERLQRMPVPYPARVMALYPVSTRVNNPRFDDPQCIEPVAPR
jgi:putative SOS response-associated peptidase YedK